jgi:CMP/dCMP kinase
VVVTLDGPGGAGKSTVSRALAKELGFAFLDTGALYRAVALAASWAEVEVDDQETVAAWLPQVDIVAQAGPGRFAVLLEGREVEPFIRNEHISQLASRLSAQPAVRAKLMELQRAAGRAGDLVAEGRDMGTVVFPEAEAKFFLTAGQGERARRRWQELKQAGHEVDFDEVLADLQRRDQRDEEREISPLRPADDAEILDTSHLSFGQVVQHLYQQVTSLA